jgi:hypothetical protein
MELVGLALVLGGGLLWLDSIKAREEAVAAGRSACQRYDLQFLDDTVSFSRLRLARNDEGELRLARTYTFEFTETGNNRRQGAVVMLGHEPGEVNLEPYELARR